LACHFGGLCHVSSPGRQWGMDETWWR
jgi:hypothetical protein